MKPSFPLIAAVLIIFASVLIQWYCTSCGILLTNDSFNYLSAAQSFRSVGEFRSPDGTFFVAWPPLFPVLLSLLPDAQANFISVHALIKIFIGILLYAMASRLIENKWIQIAFLLASMCGVHLIMISVFLWSELLYLMILLLAGFTAILVRTTNAYAIPFLLAGFLLCMQRYAGVFFVCGVSLWLMTDRAIPLRRRVILSSSYLLASMSGLVVWVLHIRSVSNEFSFGAYRFFEDPLHNLVNVLSRTGELFVTGPDWLLVGAAVVIIPASLLALRDRLTASPEVRLAVILIGIYVAGLISLGRLDRHELDRLLSVYVPLIYLVFFISLDLILRKGAPKRLRAGLLIIVLWSCYPLARTWQNVELWHHRSCFGVLDK